MKINKTLLAIVCVLIILFVWTTSCYNGMVSKEEAVTTAWSNVETQYQRRADLIPNLVNTVKGYANHESETLQGVVEARAKATQITIDPEHLTPEKIQQYQQAQGAISAALGKLLAVQEYNLQIRRFPGNIVASLFGFNKKSKFEAAEGTEKAPEVKF